MRMKLCDRKGLFTLLMKFERFDRNVCLGILLMLLSTIIKNINILLKVENQYTSVMGKYSLKDKTCSFSLSIVGWC